MITKIKLEQGEVTLCTLKQKKLNGGSTAPLLYLSAEQAKRMCVCIKDLRGVEDSDRVIIQDY